MDPAPTNSKASRALNGGKIADDFPDILTTMSTAISGFCEIPKNPRVATMDPQDTCDYMAQLPSSSAFADTMHSASTEKMYAALSLDLYAVSAMR